MKHPSPENLEEPENPEEDAPNRSTHPKLVTLGCRLNGYESAAMAKLGHDAGMTNSVIINSCAVTGEAVKQTRKSIRRAVKENPEKTIIVTGCAAQIDKQSFAQMSGVDAVIGNHEKLLPETWNNLAKKMIPAQNTQSPLSQEAPPNPAQPIVLVDDIMSVRETAPHMIDGYGDRARAFLQIQNGCDHRCTFCIIPYGRGNSRSVSIEKITEQAQILVDAGHKELVLTGVDITSYGSDLEGQPSLGKLVEHLITHVDNLFRLRLSSIDGAEIDDLLFDLVTSEERIAPYLHLSLQSGDDMILKRMKRRHNRNQAIEFCHRARALRPEIAFGADIIAGFPTESETMFQNSCTLVEEAGLSFVHVFPYSPRQGTPAARMPQIAPVVVKQRAAQLRTIADRAAQGFLRSQIGTHHNAIAESGARARLGNFAPVKLASPAPPGTILPLTITGIDGTHLTAEPNNNFQDR